MKYWDASLDYWNALIILAPSVNEEQIKTHALPQLLLCMPELQLWFL